MVEGWFGSDYLILFADNEVAAAMARYRLVEALPGYVIVGLRGWDDFIMKDVSGKTYTVPTVPLDPQYLKEFELAKDLPLKGDGRYAGKIKWYLKPLVFGGDPHATDNLTWVSHEEHGQFVVWWNATYWKHKKMSERP
jgi:hypothetical protein